MRSTSTHCARTWWFRSRRRWLQRTRVSGCARSHDEPHKAIRGRLGGDLGLLRRRDDRAVARDDGAEYIAERVAVAARSQHRLEPRIRADRTIDRDTAVGESDRVDGSPTSISGLGHFDPDPTQLDGR